MVLTARTYSTLFVPKATTSTITTTLIRLPLSVVPQYEQRCHVTGAIIPATNKPLFRNNLWSSDEHERFLHGLELFPNGPWKEVAKVVGTKSTRQTMSHAQKYRQKIARRMAPKPKISANTGQHLNAWGMTVPITQPYVLAEGSGSSVVGLSPSNIGLLEEGADGSPPDFHNDVCEVSHLDDSIEALLNSLGSSLLDGGSHAFAYDLLPGFSV